LRFIILPKIQRVDEHTGSMILVPAGGLPDHPWSQLHNFQSAKQQQYKTFICSKTCIYRYFKGIGKK
jgi:hypothetical protein